MTTDSEKERAQLRAIFEPVLPREERILRPVRGSGGSDYVPLGTPIEDVVERVQGPLRRRFRIAVAVGLPIVIALTALSTWQIATIHYLEKRIEWTGGGAS